MTTVRVLSMANGLAYVEVTFDDAGNATQVHVVNQSDQVADGVMNGVPMQVPPGTDATIPIPSPGFSAFTDASCSFEARWPA